MALRTALPGAGLLLRDQYAHNHYVEALRDLGVLGLLVPCPCWARLSGRCQEPQGKPLIVMLLAACVLQMFGQAVTDVTVVRLLLADVRRAGSYHRILRGFAPSQAARKNKGGAVRWPQPSSARYSLC
ncbi:MAG: hypothetical protein ACLRIO_04075 [Butyricicoccus sp.]